ncbi:membrane cofactor protein-like, partial [Myotis lucifugus]|uniref:membrane cofactor protein-like n=1 Tax=Myotis lucifugus TaxID=59463 RepID=UPI000CCC7FF5
ACDDPMRFETMMLNGPPKASYGPGDRVEFKCRLGYKRIVPLVPTTAVCQPDNTWAPPLQEACTEKTCPQLGEPLNGRIVYISYVNEADKFGYQAHYICNEGYYLLGTKNLYCEVTGNNVEWSDSPPQCERILCQPPKQIPNGEFSNSHKDTFEYSEVVTYSCKPSNGPDEYSLVGESRLVCSGRNQWSSNPPECKVVKCQYPVLKNGKVISGLGKKYYYKSEVTVECLEGFHLEGNKTVVCGVNNNWEPKMPECIKGRGGCDELPTFASMELKGNPAPHYTPGNTVEYECLPGYKRLIPVLPTSAVCQPDNTWTPLQEACTRKSCPQLVEPQNAQVFFTHGTFQFGSQAHYVCNEGYNLIGVDILYCNVSGNNVEWSDSPPQCEKHSTQTNKPPSKGNKEY